MILEAPVQSIGVIDVLMADLNRYILVFGMVMHLLILNFQTLITYSAFIHYLGLEEEL